NFVAGISRLKVVKAHAIMKSIVTELSMKTLSARNNVVNLDASLTEIIEMSIQRPGDIYVMDAEKVVGVIEQSDILKTVIEGTETS
ncbi:MAG: glycine/betaine ABC transporter, partial [Rhodobacteraceae bacterium]|nr:glycine/betaine ABC transporter [Paracoccaceae bacterium]